MENFSSESSSSDSWVALNFNESEVSSLSSSSFSSIEQALLESKLERSKYVSSSSSISSFSKPQSTNSSLKETPCNSGVSSPVNQSQTCLLENALPRLMQDKNNTDWVWNWSSQPTNTPPKESQLRHPKRKRTSLSLRNTETLNKYFSLKFLQILIPSVIITNLLSFGIGFILGRRSTNASQTI